MTLLAYVIMRPQCDGCVLINVSKNLLHVSSFVQQFMCSFGKIIRQIVLTYLILDAE